MIGIKDMEKPTDCKKCPLMGTDGNPKDLLSPMMCVAIWATTHKIKHCVGGEILDDCPLAEIEKRKVGKWIEEPNCWLRCSCCKSHYPHTSIYTVKGSNYCPNCGADMRGSENE